MRLELGATLPWRCVDLPQAEGRLSSADCQASVGEEFVATFTARVEPVTQTVAIEMGDDLPSALLRRVDTLGRELDSPLRARGTVSGRLRFVPEHTDVTPPGAARLIAIRAYLPGVPETMRIERTIQLHVAPVPEPGTRGRIEGYVFEDRDHDGQWTPTAEAGLAGWTVILQGPSGAATTVTDLAGRFGFAPTEPGGYVVSAGLLPEWEATLPTSLALTVPPAGCPDRACATPVFGIHKRQGLPPSEFVAAELATDRGCLETEPSAAFETSEAPTVRVRVSGLAQASVRLQADLPDSRTLTLVDSYQVAGGQWYELPGASGASAGVVRLRLSVFAAQVRPPPDATAMCSYRALQPTTSRIGVEPGFLDFGIAAPWSTSRRQLTVRNYGGRSLTVPALTIEAGVASAFHFGMPGMVRLGGFALAPGEARTVPVYATPLQEGTFTDVLRIDADDPTSPVVRVPLAVHTCCLKTASIRTERGCLESGQQPIYFVGENVGLTYRVETEGDIDVVATITEETAAGGEARTLFGPRRVPINANRAIDAGPAALPEGLRKLTIDAQSAIGDTVMQVRETCSYVVAAPANDIAGVVFADANGDGMREVGEATLAGWHLTLSGPEERPTQSGADGVFTFTVRSPGTYTVTLAAREGWLPILGAAQPVMVGGGPNQPLPAVDFPPKYRQRAAVATQAGMHVAVRAETLALAWNGDLGEAWRDRGEVYAASLVAWSLPPVRQPAPTVRVLGPLAGGAFPSGTVEQTAGGWRIAPAVTADAMLGLTALYEAHAPCPADNHLAIGLLVWEDDSVTSPATTAAWLEEELRAAAGQGSSVATFDRLLGSLTDRLRTAGDEPLGRYLGHVALPPVCGLADPASASHSEVHSLDLQSLLTEEAWQQAAEEATGLGFAAHYGIDPPARIGSLGLRLSVTKLAGQRYAALDQSQPAADELARVQLGQPDEGRVSALVDLGPTLGAERSTNISVYLDIDNDWMTGAPRPLEDGAEYRVMLTRSDPTPTASLWQWAPSALGQAGHRAPATSAVAWLARGGWPPSSALAGAWVPRGELESWSLGPGAGDLRLDIDLERLGDPARAISAWAVAERAGRIAAALPDQPHDVAPAIPLSRDYVGFPASASALEPVPETVDVPPTSAVCVQFAKSMDRRTAEEAFTLRPSQPGSFLWRADRMCFAPAEPFRPYTEHVVTVSDRAADRAGTALDGDADGLPGGHLVWRFWSGGPPLGASDEAGQPKRSVEVGEPIFLTGSELPPNATFAAYLIRHPDRTAIKDMPLADLSTDGVTPVHSDAQGELGPVTIEPAALRPGEFNIVLDADGNGRLNLDRDWLDSLGVGVSVRGRPHRAFLPALSLAP